MRKFPADLPDDARRAILHDFHVAKAYLEMGLEIKFGVWQKLPWKLAAMAYWDVTVKAAGARYCIELWESSMAAAVAACAPPGWRCFSDAKAGPIDQRKSGFMRSGCGALTSAMAAARSVGAVAASVF